MAVMINGDSKRNYWYLYAYMNRRIDSLVRVLLILDQPQQLFEPETGMEAVALEHRETIRNEMRDMDLIETIPQARKLARIIKSNLRDQPVQLNTYRIHQLYVRARLVLRYIRRQHNYKDGFIIWETLNRNAVL